MRVAIQDKGPFERQDCEGLELGTIVITEFGEPAVCVFVKHNEIPFKRAWAILNGAAPRISFEPIIGTALKEKSVVSLVQEHAS